jgi:hypothetical protein
MAKFETVRIGELKHRLPTKLLPLVKTAAEERGGRRRGASLEAGGRTRGNDRACMEVEGCRTY